MCLGQIKTISLGTQPISLTAFQNKNATHILAACDRPTVISAVHGKLTYSNVNVRAMKCVTGFNPAVPGFRDALAFESAGNLTIGRVDDIQKLHIRKIGLDEEQPRRIAYQPSSHSYVVLTIKQIIDEKSSTYYPHRARPFLCCQAADRWFVIPLDMDAEVGYIRLLDDLSFECHSYVQLLPDEGPCSVATVRFANDSANEYYVIGTAFALPDEPEPTSGRILVYRVATTTSSSGATGAAAGSGSGSGGAGGDKKLVPTAEYRVKGW